LHIVAGIAGASSRVHNRALLRISGEGSISTETRRAALTALAGLMALALPGTIASSDVAYAALVDLGALAQCDAQETLCPNDDLEPREPINEIVATIASPATRATGRLSGRLFVCRLLRSVSSSQSLTGPRLPRFWPYGGH
jgi:hypothetical protein